MGKGELTEEIYFVYKSILQSAMAKKSRQGIETAGNIIPNVRSREKGMNVCSFACLCLASFLLSYSLEFPS